jgi:hypothetical protein
LAAGESKATTIMLGALGGALGARIVDEWMPEASYPLTLGGREIKLRATTAIGAGVLVAAALGVRIPMESILVPMAGGALAYEVTAEVGDDLAALVLGLAPPGPAPLPPVDQPPVLPPGAYGYPGYPVSSYSLDQALGGLNRRF